jgi:hypothetical protein
MSEEALYLSLDELHQYARQIYKRCAGNNRVCRQSRAARQWLIGAFPFLYSNRPANGIILPQSNRHRLIELHRSRATPIATPSAHMGWSPMSWSPMSWSPMSCSPTSYPRTGCPPDFAHLNQAHPSSTHCVLELLLGVFFGASHTRPALLLPLNDPFSTSLARTRRETLTR